ncbi:hypothetical protein BDZ91DRAFT_715215 [Kalaharituber pfeilii]|nr:hypothetical protein BDZ91DRAFT_715215 [Kalaharituber pfeilii]
MRLPCRSFIARSCEVLVRNSMRNSAYHNNMADETSNTGLPAPKAICPGTNCNRSKRTADAY